MFAFKLRSVYFQHASRFSVIMSNLFHNAFIGILDSLNINTERCELARIKRVCIPFFLNIPQQCIR